MTAWMRGAPWIAAIHAPYRKVHSNADLNMDSLVLVHLKYIAAHGAELPTEDKPRFGPSFSAVNLPTSPHNSSTHLAQTDGSEFSANQN